MVRRPRVRRHINDPDLTARRLLKPPTDRQDTRGILDDFQRAVVTGIPPGETVEPFQFRPGPAQGRPPDGVALQQRLDDLRGRQGITLALPSFLYTSSANILADLRARDAATPAGVYGAGFEVTANP
ncbi:hypothetical protein QZH56_34580 [Streptomyces olivoreticuli]|uniref:hypothetical protein n=1 Tax=Streptomyces olivoreticuli TaxID=68246 RepID=UPI002659C615|nr:hypothetical protein [Streptomyces olivoreticuli]WKK23762.1 hypothetical protein QZH56_34580 [Streptomyces olivoreticuli]